MSNSREKGLTTRNVTIIRLKNSLPDNNRAEIFKLAKAQSVVFPCKVMGKPQIRHVSTCVKGFLSGIGIWISRPTC